MGNFYCNFTTRGPTADQIVDVLSAGGRSAFVSPTVGGKTVVFDERADELDPTEIDAVGELLSHKLDCPVLAAAVADDDELWLCVYYDGERSVEYSSRGANRGAGTFCRAFGRPWMVPVVWTVMQWPYLIFESWRHAMLARLLGLPTWCVAAGFGYIEDGELPQGLDASKLRRTGSRQ